MTTSFTDNEYAQQIAREVSINPDQPAGITRMAVSTWIARKIMETSGTPAAAHWRELLPHTDAIATEVLALAEPSSPPAAPAEPYRDDRDVERIGGLTVQEISGLTTEQYAVWRGQAGIGVRPAGVLD